MKCVVLFIFFVLSIFYVSGQGSEEKTCNYDGKIFQDGEVYQHNDEEHVIMECQEGEMIFKCKVIKNFA